MSYALRWKHENLRMISLVALASFALTFMFFMLLYGTAAKSVSLVINGQQSEIKTKETVLSRILDEQNIKIGQFDRTSIPLDGKIKSGDRITIERTAPVEVTADGETKTMYTVGKTVEEALRDLNIPVGSTDKVVPALHTEVSDRSPIQIVRVKKETAEEVVPLAFETETRTDANLLKGKEQVVQEGKEGSKLIQKEQVFEDGKLVSEKVLAENVKEPSTNKIVAIGSKAPPVVALSAKPAAEAAPAAAPKNGAPANYTKVLNNVTLTAYSAGVASTGKTPGDHGYGVTASGTTVTEGRTIAVDKNVIPLGWWVYIEGIGYRRAEDTGSAINGNKIDVYFDSTAYANKFGVKRGYTVYVIGPKKPE
nr:3D domain-containing protein [Paenibacillus sp. J31TS4]